MGAERVLGFPAMGRRGAGVEEESRRVRLLSFTGIFLFAFGLRLAVSSSLGHLGLWQNPQFDAHENLLWAQALASGDFAWPSPPTHGPAYPFFLALLLKVFGSIGAARVAKTALASATCVLVAKTGEIFFERVAGLAAGVLLAVSGPVSLVDVSFWEETFVGFALTSALFLLASRRTAAGAGVAGLLLGVACAARPTAVLFVLAALAFLLLFEGSPRRMPAAAARLLGVTVVLAPALFGSSRAAGRFVFVRAYGAVNRWFGKDPASGGVQGARPNGPWDRVAAEAARAGVPPSGEEAYFTRRTLQRAAADPAGLARVVLSKLVWLTQAEGRATTMPTRSSPGIGDSENAPRFRIPPLSPWRRCSRGSRSAPRHFRCCGSRRALFLPCSARRAPIPHAGRSASRSSRAPGATLLLDRLRA